VCRAENILKCKDFRAEGQTGHEVVYGDGKSDPPAVLGACAGVEAPAAVRRAQECGAWRPESGRRGGAYLTHLQSLAVLVTIGGERTW
jgi:hypothetical protein